jgi:hypothetical protein
VEIILFAVVFIVKNAKKKKTRPLLKIFYLISPQQKHFTTKFQLILEATVQGYNFRFCPFLVIGHVTIIQISHTTDPYRYNHPYVVFLYFLVKQRDFHFRMYANDPETDPESSQGNILKIAMKYPGIQLKYPNEIP